MFLLSMLRRFAPFIALIALVALYAVWLLFPITIITADIGRHVMDGRVLLGHSEWWRALLTTNFYSASNPDFPAINHHWAAGIFYTVILSAFGWSGLHLFSIALGCAAFALILDISRRLSNWWIALFIGLSLLPVIAYRLEVRPEFMGYALLGIAYWTLHRVAREGASIRLLWLLPPLIVLWVNIHASFPVGLALIGLFTVDTLLRRDPHTKMFAAVLGVSVLATLLNPAGIRGALYPLSILHDPGYAVLENQSMFFLGTVGVQPFTFLLTKIAAVDFVIAIGILGMLKKLREAFPYVAVAALTLLMAMLAVRHITLWGIAAVPVFCLAIRALLQKFPTWKQTFLISGVVLAVACTGLQLWHLSHRWIVLGLEPTANNAAHFIKSHEIHGPFFNNFDIGGYMVYHFFPQERPFVYNMPEAHPSDFWRSVYIPMMQDNVVWQEQLSKYDFNAIVLFHGDRTGWGQEFLVARLQDPQWAPVFVDRSIIVLVRRNGKNGDVITQFEIPRSQLLK